MQNLTVAYTKKGDVAKAKETLARLENMDANNTAIPKLREELQKIETKRSIPEGLDRKPESN